MYDGMSTAVVVDFTLAPFNLNLLWSRADGPYPVGRLGPGPATTVPLAVFLVGGRVPVCGHSGPAQRRGRCQEVACPPHNGTLQRWDSLPIASEKGQKVVRAHPGRWVFCRCWPEPVLPDRIR
jgi:hypothetical protein